MDLRNRAGWVWKVVNPEAADDQIERLVPEGQRLGVAMLEHKRRAASACLSDHCSTEINTRYRSPTGCSN